MARRLFNTVTLLLVVAGILLLVAFAGVRLVGLTPYAVTSGSMEPTYPVGSLIYVRAAAPEEVDVGDAITFRLASGTLVTHQAYEVDTANRVFRTQGIANRNADGSTLHDAEPVAFDALVGKPLAAVPLLGFVNAFLVGPAGIFAIIAVLGVLIGASLLVDRHTNCNGRNRRPAHGVANDRSRPLRNR